MTAAVNHPPLSAVVRNETSVVVTRQNGESVVVRQPATTSVFVVRGIPGTSGSGGAVGALMTANRLSEFASSPTAQLDAQQNIGLGAVDPLAYYILAKA